MTVSGQKTIAIAGTAQPLGSQAVNSALVIKALAANSGLVFIGCDAEGTVSAGSGFQLAAGEQVVLRFAGDLAHVWLDAEVSGEGVCWMALEV